jgi:hypothetical protein
LGIKLFEELLISTIHQDNTSKTRFGLAKDKVLQFIDRTRCYLTTNEQQVLFENQAKRSSKIVYVYLSIYALIARGFAYRRPEFIHRARQLLVDKLGQRSDVNLEHALCALLLGDTTTASDLIQKTQEQEVLKDIKLHSNGAEDLLPGLCWYTEHWLKTQVFPHFRDLIHQSSSLQDYFANIRVQEYLENLPDDMELSFGWTELEFDDVLNPPLHPKVTRFNLPQLPDIRSPQIVHHNAGGSALVFEEQNKPHLSITTNSLPSAERISPELSTSPSDKVIPFDPNLRKSRRSSIPTNYGSTRLVPEKTKTTPKEIGSYLSGEAPGTLVPIDHKGLARQRSSKSSELARRRRKLPVKFWIRLGLMTTLGTAAIWSMVSIAGYMIQRRNPNQPDLRQPFPASQIQIETPTPLDSPIDC